MTLKQNGTYNQNRVIVVKIPKGKLVQIRRQQQTADSEQLDCNKDKFKISDKI